MNIPKPENPATVAECWRIWCGDTPWSQSLEEFGSLGGTIAWWCGYPRSASAIPLTFELFLPDGTKFPTNYRLKDIKASCVEAEKQWTRNERLAL